MLFYHIPPRIASPPLFREKAWQKASLCTIKFPGLRRFRGAFTPLLRLADFCGAPRRALAKTGALRQTQLPVSSTGRGRCVCSSLPAFGAVPRCDAKFCVAWFAHFVRFENLYRTITLVLYWAGVVFGLEPLLGGAATGRRGSAIGRLGGFR